MNLEQLKEFWESVLVGRRITKLFFDKYGLKGFLLDDGVKVNYDYKGEGLFIEFDKYTGSPQVFN